MIKGKTMELKKVITYDGSMESRIKIADIMATDIPHMNNKGHLSILSNMYNENTCKVRTRVEIGDTLSFTKENYGIDFIINNKDPYESCVPFTLIDDETYCYTEPLFNYIRYTEDTDIELFKKEMVDNYSEYKNIEVTENGCVIIVDEWNDEYYVQYNDYIIFSDIFITIVDSHDFKKWYLVINE